MGTLPYCAFTDATHSVESCFRAFLPQCQSSFLAHIKGHFSVNLSLLTKIPTGILSNDLWYKNSYYLTTDHISIFNFLVVFPEHLLKWEFRNSFLFIITPKYLRLFPVSLMILQSFKMSPIYRYLEHRKLSREKVLILQNQIPYL
jgi:hypothetical protein